MEIIYSDIAQDDLLFWMNSGNTKIQSRISKLIKDIEFHPYTGLGKPKPLKYQYDGYWSRRITKEHRIIYLYDNINIYIHSLRYHYDK